MYDDEMRRRGAFRGDRMGLRLTMRERMADDGCLIAYAMGLRLTKTLTADEKVALLGPPWECTLPPDERHNFLLTPLMLETTDRKGETVYLAMVIAYVAERSDARTAICTAEHLARLTGHTARPVVAARLISDWLDEMVKSEQVFWHKLNHSFLERIEHPRETEKNGR